VADVPSIPVRGLARLVDLGVQFGLMEVAFRLTPLLPSDGLIHLSEDALFWVDLGVGLSAMLAYTTVSEWLAGATVGKHLTGLRVVGADTPDVPVGLRSALLRNLALIVDLLIFGYIAYSTMIRSPERQRLGDHWGGTRVVWKADAPNRSALVGWPVGMLTALSLVLASYVLAS